jgi:branched-chain amino acid transport system permease protein
LDLLLSWLPLLVIGLVVGSVYSVAAAGLVLSYRASGIFNFAYGAIGMFSAFFFAWLVQRAGLPVVAAAIVAVGGMAPLLGVALETAIFRPLREAATVVKIVVTIGLLIALQGLASTLWGRSGLRAQPIFPSTVFRVSSRLSISADQVGIVAIAAFVSVCLWLFLRHTRLGTSMRAVVDRPELAELMGLSSRRIAAASWALGSALAALAGVMLTPQVSLEVFILTLLVINAYAAAMVGRLESLPLTFAGGIALGLAETFMGRYVPRTIANSLVPSLPFVFLFALLVLPRRTPLREPREAAASAPPRPTARRATGDRGAGARIAKRVALVAAALLVPLALGPRWILVTDQALGYAMIMLSLVILTGYAGQISLGQAGLAAVGAVVAAHLVRDLGVPWLAALPLAGLASMPIGAALAFPALRLHGLFLALATFAFSLMMEKGVLVRHALTGGTSGLGVDRPAGFSSDHALYYLWIVVFGLMAWGAHNLRRGRAGRIFAAMRDSEVAARSIGVSMTRYKVAAFALAAFVAGVGGAAYTATNQRVSSTDFIALLSLVFLAVAVIGGISSWVGALLGGIVFSFVPVLASLPNIPVLDDLVPVAFGLGAIALAQNPHGIVTEPRRILGALGRVSGAAISRYEEATRVEGSAG